MIIFLADIAVLALVIGGYAKNNMNYGKGTIRRTKKAGFTEKQAVLSDGSVINYGEGKSAGVPLLLIHGQGVSWEDYAKVLGGLSKAYHVYAVDCYGHGGSSKDQKKYTAAANGADLVWFIENVIGEPVVVSGHSSGGLLAIWIAANSPENVRGLIIEDAPIFATEPDRCENTFAWRDSFQPIHKFLNQSAVKTYTEFALRSNFMQTMWGENGWEKIVVPAVEKRMAMHLNEIKIWYLPAAMNRYFAMWRCVQDGNGEYDLRFGDKFYDCSWLEGYHQEEALHAVQCPSVLLHTAVTFKDGILLGAMTAEDSARAHSLLADNVLIDDIKSGHDIHYEKPKLFTNVLMDFLARIQ